MLGFDFRLLIHLLNISADELKIKIETEQTEIERFQEEIAEIRSIREGLYSDESSDSSDSSEDEDDLQEVLYKLKKENRQLEVRFIIGLSYIFIQICNIMNSNIHS